MHSTYNPPPPNLPYLPLFTSPYFFPPINQVPHLPTTAYRKTFVNNKSLIPSDNRPRMAGKSWRMRKLLFSIVVSTHFTLLEYSLCWQVRRLLEYAENSCKTAFSGAREFNLCIQDATRKYVWHVRVGCKSISHILTSCSLKSGRRSASALNKGEVKLLWTRKHRST